MALKSLRIQVYFLLCIVVVITSCNPTVRTTIYQSRTPHYRSHDVTLIGLGNSRPESSEVLGVVKIGDTGFSTRCGLVEVLANAKVEAVKIGGNAIRLIEHRPPSPFGSTCHRITAEILYVENISEYAKETDVVMDIDYAVLRVYRPGGSGALVGYNLHLEDSVICRVRSNYKTSIRLDEEGLKTLWAKTEARAEMPILIEKGRTYYLRCSIKTGIVVGQPVLELVPGEVGRFEFEALNAKHE